MARVASSGWIRTFAGLALFFAGAVLFVARPGIALAHHVVITEGGDCGGWSTKAEYIGGDSDRKVVVDVMVNGEHISQTFYFDNGPGHLGHQDYYLLYQRSGTGAVTTSGTVTMYEKSHGSYSVLAGTDTAALDLVCATATPTATATTPPPTATPSPTATVEIQGTITPIPTSTHTPQPTSTSAPPATATATPDSTSTPDSSATPPIKTHTPAPTGTPSSSTTTPAAGTPTLTSSVLGAVPPDQPRRSGPPPEAPSGRAFPDTGNGLSTGGGIAAGFVAALLGAVGLFAIGSGLREKR